jgi:hypothetical protein
LHPQVFGVFGVVTVARAAVRVDDEKLVIWIPLMVQVHGRRRKLADPRNNGRLSKADPQQGESLGVVETDQSVVADMVARTRAGLLDRR